MEDPNCCVGFPLCTVDLHLDRLSYDRNGRSSMCNTSVCQPCSSDRISSWYTGPSLPVNSDRGSTTKHCLCWPSPGCVCHSAEADLRSTPRWSEKSEGRLGVRAPQGMRSRGREGVLSPLSRLPPPNKEGLSLLALLGGFPLLALMAAACTTSGHGQAC